MNEFLVLTRAIHFGAVLWLLGEFVLFAVVVAPALRSISEHASIDSREPERRLFRVAGLCVAIGIASAIAWLLLVLSAVLWLGWRQQARRKGAMLKIGGTLLAGSYAATLAWTGHALSDT